jgi:hypothetical protein
MANKVKKLAMRNGENDRASGIVRNNKTIINPAI